MSTAFLNLGEASKVAPSKPSTNSLWRWCRRGLKARNGQRVYLKHYRVGGKIYTTEKDLNGFFEALAEADAVYFGEQDGPTPTSVADPSPKARRNAIELAERELAEHGV